MGVERMKENEYKKIIVKNKITIAEQVLSS